MWPLLGICLSPPIIQRTCASVVYPPSTASGRCCAYSGPSDTSDSAAAVAPMADQMSGR